MKFKYMQIAVFVFCLFFTAGHLYLVVDIFSRAKAAVEGVSGELYSLIGVLQEKVVMSFVVVSFFWACVCLGLLLRPYKPEK